MDNSIILNHYPINMSNSVVAEILTETLNSEPCELIKLHNGLIIALSPRALGCYRNQQSLHDPLGNGLISFSALDPEYHIQFHDQRCITTYSGGYVGLLDGKALLIAPYKVRLYPNNQDGLRGQNCLAELELPEIDVL
ncbi:MAG: hypothetical protein CMK89_06025 [Pseudomonadales bacterium]|nr:hypothetical protein [Pseudomonadales bacterium]RLU03498.1 MAG: hypothetical protein D9N11_03840 [Ketobacter sp.]